MSKKFTNYQNFKVAREHAGLSQSQASKKLGITQSSLSTYETGERQVPLTILTKMSKVYKISYEDLLNKKLSLTITTKIKKSRDIEL